MNCDVDGTHDDTLTLDGAWLAGSPAGNSGAGYRVGGDGLAIWAQWQIAF